MSIPSRLSSYLEQRGARYEVCTHELSHSSAETARAAQLPPHQIAKSVILEDGTGCVMAVLPADKAVVPRELAELLGRKSLHLADEERVARLLADCDRGAVPPVGMAWGIETVVDDELVKNEVVYCEAGDHEHLLRLSRDQFERLMRDARRGHFCRAPMMH